MADYLITRLSPGTTRAKIVHFFNGIEHPFFVSSKVDEISGFMLDFEESVVVHSNQSFPLETKGNKAEHEIIKGPQRLVSGQDVRGQLKCSGPNPFSIQRDPSLFRPVRGTAVGSNSSLQQHEPRALNAVDILTETASGCLPSLMFSSGTLNALDSIVKKEEGPNPLFSQDPPRLHPTHTLSFLGTHAEALMEECVDEDATVSTKDTPRPQPTHTLFSLGTHAEALMETDVDEDVIVATESLIKEEIDDDVFEDPEDLKEDYGVNMDTMTETHQVFSTADLTLKRLQNPGLLKCVACNDVFSTRSLFLEHVSAHPECKVPGRRTLIQCHICGKYLSSKTTLTDHLRIHIGERPFECEFCQKRFGHKTVLRMHLRAHTGQKPFECTWCRKKFTTNGNLARHLRTHSGEKPFGCTECQKSFADRANLNRHRRKLHASEEHS